ncbi:MAG TPA: hypothetical protein VGJ70_18555 [Solirubrobacteraceae bacterium]
MAEQARSLEIDEALDFQQRFARIQRVLAAAGPLLLLAAVVGVFGTGPLAHATATGSGGLRVEYDRFVRAEASTSVVVTVPAGKGNTNVAVDNGYLDKTEVGSVAPEPSSVTALPDRVLYTVDLSPPAKVHFDVTPQQAGVRHVTIWAGGGRRVRFTQIVYP